MLVYILVRLFTFKRKFIEGDELRHMACAKNFYKLWNKSFYDTHPPLYSLLIKCLSWFGHYRAGVIVSFLCSIGLFIMCGRLYDLLGLPVAQKSVALACLTFNYTLIYYSNKAFRYQLIALVGTSMMVALLSHEYFFAGLMWGSVGLTCTFAGLRGFWVWVLMGVNPYSIAIFMIIYGSWIAKKAMVYTDSFTYATKPRYYPAGIDGKIEPMDNLTLQQVFSPLYFPWTYAYYGKKELGYDFKNWFKKIGGVYGLYQTKYNILNPFLYVLTITMLYFTIRGMMLSSWPLVVLTLILLYPSLLKRFLPRNSIIAIPLICYFLGKGIPQFNPQYLNFLLFGGVALFLCFNRGIILENPKIKARVTSRIMNRFTKDGFLVEGLIAYPIAYQSHKRIVVIPHDPEEYIAIQRVNLSIKEFNLKYAVFSELWKSEEHLGYPAINYIKDHCLLINKVYENGDIYYIYEISTDLTA